MVDVEEGHTRDREPAPAQPVEPTVSVEDQDQDQGSAAVREELDALRGSLAASLHAGSTLEAFYEARHNRPAFATSDHFQEEATQILEAVRHASDRGLSLAEYDLEAFEVSITHADANRVLLEIRLLDIWLSVANRLLAGSVDPTTVHPEWNHPPRSADVVAALEKAVKTHAFRDQLFALDPRQPAFVRLLDAFARYREQRDDAAWTALRLPTAFAPGATGADVVALRTRLRATGDLAASADGPFDEEAGTALRSFQGRHGLKETGTLDPDTLRALNVSPKQRAEQIAANLERWRWLPEDLGESHVRVNIAAFTVEAWRSGKRELVMEAVVGKPYRRTPAFSDEITHIVLNPRWSVPIKLATKDILPKIKKDPKFLEKKGFRVFRAATGVEVEPAEVPWNELGTRKFGYILRQEPGADNALGQLKIMFPNDYDVYLHDTPKRHLFKEPKRAFSSGCVRLADPRALATFLLDDPAWTRDRMDKAISSGRQQTLWLGKPVPIHLQYWTAWVDEAGVLNFREDLYGRDAALIEALGNTPER